jgi:carboxypeptidase T
MNKRLKATSGWLAATLTGAVAVGCSLATPVIAPSASNLTGNVGTLSLQGRRFVQTGETIVSIPYRSKAELQKYVDGGMDVWMVQPGSVSGAVGRDLLNELKETGVKFTMLSPTEGYSIRSSFDKGYQTTASLPGAMRALAAKYPAICKVEDFGDTWEKKQGKGGSDLLMFHIGGGTAKNEKPGIVFFGNHHARELVTVEIPLRLATLLLEGYGKDPAITDLVDSRDIYIAPMINPDGHVHAEKGESWRKNTHSDKGSEVAIEDRGYFGTDLNRNYGFKWASGGSSSNPSDETYMGKTAFSEPETQAVRDFVTSHKNIKIMMSYHSFSNLVLWPWGWSNSPTPDAAKLSTIGKKLAAPGRYTPEQASDLYIASGITDDFTYGQLGMLSFTTEIGGWNDHFDPPYSRVDKFWGENKDGALYLIKLAGDTGAAFGPEPRLVNGKVVFESHNVTGKVAEVETYVGKPGAPGTGTKVTTRGESLDVASLAAEGKGRLFVRGRDVNGNWGPALAVRL